MSLESKIALLRQKIKRLASQGEYELVELNQKRINVLWFKLLTKGTQNV